MDEMNEQKRQRLLKLEELRAMNIDPFGGPFNQTHHAKDIFAVYSGSTKDELELQRVEVRLAGRIITLRNFGRAAFAHIQDSTGRMQIYVRRDLLGESFLAFSKVDIGDIIGVTGYLFRTKTDELTVEVHAFELLSKSLHPLPEKWHGLKDIEQRYRQRYVDLIVNPAVKETFVRRSQIIKRIRDFFENHGFIEVETPMMHQIPGGATARPFKTHHNALDLDLYLRIAPELYLKRLLIGGFERVYELNKNFRNEGISTRHNPEFTMLEFYMAYKDYHFLMSLTEKLFGFLAMEICGSLKVPFESQEIDLTPPWPRVTFLEALTLRGVPEEVLGDRDKAVRWASESGIEVGNDASLGKVLDEIFKEKVEPYLINPVFITDYPIELSPLAKRKSDNPALVERFELFIASREIANAFSELNDPLDQKERFLRQAEDRMKGDEEAHWLDEDFIRALEYGMPPAAGEGIGIDRVVMLLTNSVSIRDVLIFPQMKPEK